MEYPASIDHHTGLEIAPGTEAERIAPSNIHLEDKFYNAGSTHEETTVSNEQPSTLGQVRNRDNSHRPTCGSRAVCWTLAFFAVVCLAAALGAGLGGGLATQSKYSSTTPGTGQETYSSNPIPTPLTSFSTPATSPSSLETSSRTTLAACPSANGTTYTATNRPLPTFPGALTNATFEFKIACNTNWGPYGGVMDVAILSSISSLNDCMDTCAKFTWQANPNYYKTQGCSGAVWTRGISGVEHNTTANVCVLKANVSQSTRNGSYIHPGYDGAILLYI